MEEPKNTVTDSTVLSLVQPWNRNPSRDSSFFLGSIVKTLVAGYVHTAAGMSLPLISISTKNKGTCVCVLYICTYIF